MTNTGRPSHPLAWILALLGVASVLAYFVDDWRGADDRESASDVRYASSSRSESNEKLGLQSNAPPIDATTGSDEEASNGWFGRVVDDRGSPYPRVAVRVRSSESAEKYNALADENGVFRFDRVPASRNIWLSATSVPETERYLPVHLATHDSSRRRNLGDVVLPRPVTIRGVVIDQHGNPVPDVIVEPEVLERLAGATTDAAGRFELRFEVGTFDIELHVRAADAFEISLAEEPLRLVPGEVTDGIQLRVERGRKVDGRVVDRHGNAVADAEVTLIGTRAPKSTSAGERRGDQLTYVTRTDRDGRFARLVPESAAEFEIVVQHPECDFLREPVVIDDPSPVLVSRFSVLRLIARDAGSAAPIAGLAMRIGFSTGDAGLNAWSYSNGQPWTKSDDTGLVRQRLDQVPLEDVTVIVEAPGFLRARLDPISLAEIDAKPIEVALVRGGSVRGTVLDAKGRPRANAAIEARIPPAPGASGADMIPVSLGSATTGDDGRYELAGLPESSIELAVRLHVVGDALSRPLTIVPCDVIAGDVPIDLDLQLPHLGSIEGVVLDGEAQSRGAYFVECSDGNGAEILVEVAADGRFEIRDVAMGTAKLTLRMPALEPSLPGLPSQELMIDSGRPVVARFELDPQDWAIVTAQVTLEGQPVVGGQIEFHAEDRKNEVGRLRLGLGGRSPSTWLPPGRYRVRVRDVLDNELALRTIELDEGQQSSIDLDLHLEK